MLRISNKQHPVHWDLYHITATLTKKWLIRWMLEISDSDIYINGTLPALPGQCHGQLDCSWTVCLTVLWCLHTVPWHSDFTYTPWLLVWSYKRYSSIYAEIVSSFLISLLQYVHYLCYTSTLLSCLFIHPIAFNNLICPGPSQCHLSKAASCTIYWAQTSKMSE